jgi:ring-1,2-phenylacetyl-CoA epoxidase subunit PaaC
MAQDKIGQAQALYQILNTLGEDEPDTIAFMRGASEFHNSQFVELPNGDYDFSSVRHFLYDHADQIRFNMLAESSYEPLAKVARKIKGELKYHVFHADTWLVKLGNGNEESKARMQSSLNMAWNYALGMFEEGNYESKLISENVFAGENELKKQWLASVTPIIEKANLKIPAESDWNPVLGGRKGYHTEHLDQLVDEMSEVFRIEPNTEW